MLEHEYLAVACKTQGCEQHILIHYMGAHESLLARQVRPPEGIEFFECRCVSCGQSHRYALSEVQGRIGPEPASDFVSHPLFREETESPE
jgi:hypothetical protein